jgi:serine/threonine protein kinase
MFVHDKGVVHGNLTCVRIESYSYDGSVWQLDLQTNVSISADGRLHLADFGLSMIFSESQNSSFSSCHQGNVMYGGWRLGCLLYLSKGGVVMPTMWGRWYLLIWLHYTSGVYYASYCADHVQLFCGHEPYVWLTQAHHVIAARVAGVEPFRQFTGIEHSLTCISVKYRDQPVTSVIVEFLGAE